jgi:TPR repeat protein
MSPRPLLWSVAALLAFAGPVPCPARAQATTPLSQQTQQATAAFDRKDYPAAWRLFMAQAQQGDAEAEAGVGVMLMNRLNPPGTGFYPSAEKWLAASAAQNNPKGETYLAKFYYDDAKRFDCGNAGNGGTVRDAPPGRIAPASSYSNGTCPGTPYRNERLQKARSLFERAAAQGDGYAMASLSIMLDAGLGGPADPARAAKLRQGVYTATHGDAGFTRKATADPATLAMTAQWQQGQFAQALAMARGRAQTGDAASQALLGRAYLEGLGVPRDYALAKYWLDLGVKGGNADAMFFLGLIYEYGHGIPPNVQHALQLFDDAAAKGQKYADMEARGMRAQAQVESDARKIHGNALGIACGVAGGVSVGPECIRGGETIDPFKPMEPPPTVEEPQQ